MKNNFNIGLKNPSAPTKQLCDQNLNNINTVKNASAPENTEFNLS
jgi:hypothetical protein